MHSYEKALAPAAEALRMGRGFFSCAGKRRCFKRGILPCVASAQKGTPVARLFAYGTAANGSSAF